MIVPRIKSAQTAPRPQPHPDWAFAYPGQETNLTYNVHRSTPAGVSFVNTALNRPISTWYPATSNAMDQVAQRLGVTREQALNMSLESYRRKADAEYGSIINRRYAVPSGRGHPDGTLLRYSERDPKTGVTTWWNRGYGDGIPTNKTDTIGSPTLGIGLTSLTPTYDANNRRINVSTATNVTDDQLANMSHQAWARNMLVAMDHPKAKMFQPPTGLGRQAYYNMLGDVAFHSGGGGVGLVAPAFAHSHNTRQNNPWLFSKTGFGQESMSYPVAMQGEQVYGAYGDHGVQNPEYAEAYSRIARMQRQLRPIQLQEGNSLKRVKVDGGWGPETLRFLNHDESLGENRYLTPDMIQYANQVKRVANLQSLAGAKVDGVMSDAAHNAISSFDSRGRGTANHPVTDDDRVFLDNLMTRRVLGAMRMNPDGKMDFDALNAAHRYIKANPGNDLFTPAMRQHIDRHTRRLYDDWNSAGKSPVPLKPLNLGGSPRQFIQSGRIGPTRENAEDQRKVAPGLPIPKKTETKIDQRPKAPVEAGTGLNRQTNTQTPRNTKMAFEDITTEAVAQEYNRRLQKFAQEQKQSQPKQPEKQAQDTQEGHITQTEPSGGTQPVGSMGGTGRSEFERLWAKLRSPEQLEQDATQKVAQQQKVAAPLNITSDQAAGGSIAAGAGASLLINELMMRRRLRHQKKMVDAGKLDAVTAPSPLGAKGALIGGLAGAGLGAAAGIGANGAIPGALLGGGIGVIADKIRTRIDNEDSIDRGLTGAK